VKRLVRYLIVAAVLIFVFVWLLPQIIDYELIWEAITNLTVPQLLVLCALTTVRIPTEALIYRAMLPGLSVATGSEAYLSSNVAANVMPPPASSIVQYAYFRSDGFDGDRSMTAAVGSFVFPQGGRILLPLVAFCVLLVTGDVDNEVLIITGISLAVAAAVGVVIWLVGRGESSARWLGRQLGRAISWVMVKLHKDPVGDLGDAVVSFRDNAYAVVRERWAFGTVATAANLVVSYLILVASLRFVDVPHSELGLAAIFAAFSVAFFAGTVIPITGSGLGVVDVVMISALAASTSANVNILVAGVILWRVFYSLITIIPGAVTLSRFGKRNRDLLDQGLQDIRHGDEEPAT
jgi:uncharacterized membrane protein YbhN (UPF0104 family)